MSNYIHPKNQTILWNTVNKIPEFYHLSPPKKDLEFKQIIEFFYRKNSHKSILTIPELQQLNRETILAFIPNFKQSPNLPSSEEPKMPMFETKQEQSQRQFEERQNIYKQMNEKPDLPSPEIFKDKYEDTAIENMDALINNFQKQRELEFNQFLPPLPPVVNQPLLQNQLQNQKKNPRVRILEDISEDDKSQQIGEIEIEKKKKVSFSIDNNTEYTITNTNDDFWEKRVMRLEERIFLLEEKIINNEIKHEVHTCVERILQKI